MPHELAPLPYPKEALEPHIDAQTMEIHHGRHHKAYVDNLNKAIAGNAAADTTSDLQKIMDTYATALNMGDVEKLVGLYSPKGVFMREEMKAVTAAAATNKTDPMMTLFGTILQTQSANATETARMIREAGDRAAAASEVESLTTFPSRMTTRRSAWAAISASCVTRITVLPCRCSSSKSAIETLPDTA